MGLSRKKGSRELDQFGPGDVLIAAAATLPIGHRDAVLKYVMDEGFADHAFSFSRRLQPHAVESFNDVCRTGFASCSQLVKTRTNHDAAAAQMLLSGVLRVFGLFDHKDEYKEEFWIALAGIRGGKRMVELRRQEQAMVAITFAVILLTYVVHLKSHGVTTYVVYWGKERRNKCTFFVNGSQEISWTPDHHEPPMIGEANVIAALSELEMALGKPVSFEDQLVVPDKMIEPSVKEVVGVQLTGEHGVAKQLAHEPFFEWEPPLPQRNVK